MSILPDTTFSGPLNELYARNTGYGVVFSQKYLNLTWTVVSSGVYSSQYLTIPGLTSTSIAVATVRSGSLADIIACPLLMTTVDSAGLQFFLKANPTSPELYGISVVITRF